MLSVIGIPQGIIKKEILKISKDTFSSFFKHNRVTIIKDGMENTFSKYVLTSDKKIQKNKRGIMGVDPSFLKILGDGDIISIQSDGRINLIYQKQSDDNVLFVTDYCNSKCIMCPQAEVEHPNNYYEEVLLILSLISDTPKYLCISGGEPTVLNDEYVRVVKYIQNKFPSVALQVLTNGKNFSDFTFLKKCILNSPIDTLYSIPIYSGNSSLHDEIVKSTGSFEKTIKGIINLYRFSQNVEIRVVITKKNYKDLINIAHFIYWNMPFVFRISFMGMEVHGHAEENVTSVWVDAADYNDILEEAVTFLVNRELDVMIYNLPQCVLPLNLRRYAKDSISEWKKTFLDPCKQCSVRNICSGVFTTSSKIPSGIHSM